MNERIEREQVLDPCLRLCRQLLGTHILQYRRLDALDAFHVSGSPDIEIWVPKDNLVWIIMAECKKPSGGIFSTKQKEFQKKYELFKNVNYVGITDVKQLRELIFNTSDYGCEKLSEFNNIKDL